MRKRQPNYPASEQTLTRIDEICRVSGVSNRELGSLAGVSGQRFSQTLIEGGGVPNLPDILRRLGMAISLHLPGLTEQERAWLYLLEIVPAERRDEFIESCKVTAALLVPRGGFGPARQKPALRAGRPRKAK